ncbi:MAG TPA: GNAT family N-acetyltransferase [Jatrophihabitans sp.]|nr:GNAT family N-acetyltransferase [Jatrophihabitans sp.]
MSDAWMTTAVRPEDRARWDELYIAYGDFYETPMPPDKLDRVWGWLADPAHVLNAVVLRHRPDGQAMGLAHYRPYPRPLRGTVSCFLDDLFVDPAVRGTGAVDALLGELARIAGRNGWDGVRWITRESNRVARSAYDRLASQTDLVTYELPASRS